MPWALQRGPLHSSKGKAKGPFPASSRWSSGWLHTVPARIDIFLPAKYAGTGVFRGHRRPRVMAASRVGIIGCGPAPESNSPYGGGGEPGVLCAASGVGAIGCLGRFGKITSDGVGRGFSRGSSGRRRRRGSHAKPKATIALVASTFRRTMTSSGKFSFISLMISARTRRSGRLCATCCSTTNS